MQKKRMISVTERVNAIIEKRGYCTWGAARNIIDSLGDRTNNAFSIEQGMTQLMGLLTMAQFTQGMRENQEKLGMSDATRKNQEFKDQALTRDFSGYMFFNLPTVMTSGSKEKLDTLISSALNDSNKKDDFSGTRDAFTKLLEMNGDIFNLPRGRNTTKAVIIEEFWDYYKRNIPSNVIDDMIRSTLDLITTCIHEMEQEGFVTQSRHNLITLSNQFNLDISKDQTIEAIEWWLLFNYKKNQIIQPFFWKAIVGETMPTEWSLFLHEVDRFRNAPPGQSAKLLYEDSLLVHMGVVESHPPMDEWLDNKKQLINSKFTKAVIAGYTTKSEMLTAVDVGESLVNEVKSHLSLADFAHMGSDIENIIHMMNAKTALRALIVGPSGSGKTSLIEVCAQAAGKKIMTVKRSSLLCRWNGGGELDMMRKRARLYENCILCIDPATVWLTGSKEYNETLSTLRESMSGTRSLTTEIWVVDGLENIDSETVKMFDLIVNVGVMPMVYRQKLAETYFDNEIAKQLARVCSYPQEIVSSIEWSKSTGRKDWMHLSARLTTLQQSSIKAKEHDGTLPVQLFPPKMGGVGFEDVAGLPELVKKARRVIGSMRDPERYKAMGVSPPKGILLTGGPGCGKTHLARAMAAEAGVSMLLADSAAMARDPKTISSVFAEARRQSPCILFLDELDAIGTKAKGAMGASPDPERQAILNRLLTELDGFEGLDGVLVIGATHRSELLDEALVRSGRLGVHFKINEPTRKERQAIWEHYAKKVQCSDTINWERIGRISAGMTPADISQAVKMAALQTIEEDQDLVGAAQIRRAIDEILWGDECLNIPMHEDELWRTSVHEAGHALLAWRNRSDIERVSVKPRNSSLGFVSTLPEEGRYGKNPGDILSQIAMFFGGMCAEIVIFGEHSNGNTQDLLMARRIARNAIRSAGMNESVAPAGIENSVIEPSPSETTLHLVEQEEREMLRNMRTQTLAWLEQHKTILQEFAQHLMKEREIDGEEATLWLDQHMPTEARKGKTVYGHELSQAAKNWL